MLGKIKQWFTSQTEGNKKPSAKEMLLQYVRENAFEEKMSIPVEEYFSEISNEDYIDIIKAMSNDYQIKSDIDLLVSKIFKKDWSIVPGDENNSRSVEAAEFMDTLFSRKSNSLLKEMKKFSEALYWGKSVNEVLWEKPELNDGKNIIKKLVNVSSDRFTFDTNGQLVDNKNEVNVQWKYKFLIFTHNEKQGNLNGTPQILPAYWPWHFRNKVIESTAIYVHKSILPSIIALMDAGGSEDKMKAAMELLSIQLMNLESSSGAAFANVNDIKVVEATGKADEYVAFTDLYDKMISKAILSTPRLTNETRYSSNDSADRDNDLVDDIADDIASTEVVPCINTVIEWHMELNFPDLPRELYPEFIFYSEEKADIKNIIEFAKLGFPLKKDSLIKDHNIPLATEDDDQDNIIVKEQAQPAAQQFTANNDSLFFLQKMQSKTESSNRYKNLTTSFKNIKSK